MDDDELSDLQINLQAFVVNVDGVLDNAAWAPRRGTETFRVLPPSRDGRFAVLAYARESPVPEPDRHGEKAWRAFLSSAEPVAEPKKKR